MLFVILTSIPIYYPGGKKEKSDWALINFFSKFVQQQLFLPPVPVTEAVAQPCRLNRWD